MTVRRIVPNVAADNVPETQEFYGELLGLTPHMDLGGIVIFGSPDEAGEAEPLDLASEQSAGPPVANVSVEVDDVDDTYGRAKAAGFDITYELTDEPWGVRWFHVRDPFGTLVNVLSRIPQAVSPAPATS